MLSLRELRNSMKKRGFLNKLRREGKIGLVEPSEELKASYLSKSDNCLKAARILLDNKLYENVVINAYYSMYHAVLALLFKVGIKSENHAASLIFFQELFHQGELAKILRDAKEERIDKQYYVESEENASLTEESVQEMVLKAEDFAFQVKVCISKLSTKDTEDARKAFHLLFVKKKEQQKQEVNNSIPAVRKEDIPH